MKIPVIFLLVIALTVSGGCRKRKYPPEQSFIEKEVIFVEATIGNEPVVLKAGTDGYYGYTSCAQRQDSVYVLAGELRKYDCEACPSSFRLELSDYRRRAPGSAVNADSVLRTGNRGFVAPSRHTFTLASHSNKVITSVRWNFSDGTSSQEPIALHNFHKAGLQTVSLTVRSGNCENTVINRIYIGTDGTFLSSGIDASSSGNKTATFTAEVNGGRPPFKYSWNFGDGQKSALPSPSHTYQWPGSYPVKLFVEDADGRVCESNFNHVTAGDPSSCAARISVGHTGTVHSLLDNVKLQWTDQANVVFSSAGILQPSDSYFEIIKSEEYERNDAGQPTRLLTMRINVLMSDGSRSIRFRTENAVMAVAYQQK